jgi:hypothetical protein
VARSAVDVPTLKFGFGAQGPKMRLPIRHWSGESCLGRGDCAVERCEQSRHAATYRAKQSFDSNSNLLTRTGPWLLQAAMCVNDAEY